MHAVGADSPRRAAGRRLPALLHTPLYWFSGGLAVLAIASCAALLLVDGVPQVRSRLSHAPVSAAPLLLIGLAYLALQPLVRPGPLELLKRVLLGTAFILWGIDQLLPSGRLATVLGDVVIALYVLDLGLIIRDHLRREDWETP